MIPERETDFVKATKDFVKAIAQKPVYGILDTLRGQESVTEPVFSHKVFFYVQALEYAVEKKLKYSNIKSTLLELNSLPEGLLIRQVFIDDTGEIVQKRGGYLGRELVAEEIDEELKDILGNNKSVVIDLP